MDRGVTPTTTQLDTSLLSREDLLNFRRHLLGVLACVELALHQGELTVRTKERMG